MELMDRFSLPILDPNQKLKKKGGGIKKKNNNKNQADGSYYPISP